MQWKRGLNLSVASHDPRILPKRLLSSYMADLIYDPSPPPWQNFNGVVFEITTGGFYDGVDVPQHDNLTKFSQINNLYWFS